ncbi:MAG: N-acetylmuramoyl-L-alanine amidase [Sandaracinaceae bacterium]|nr:N-acetylmuramoyl-L-alanine amidase [Sandaracinaceae bacterium]
MLALVLGACGTTEPPADPTPPGPAPEAPFAPPEVDDAWALSLPDLRDQTERTAPLDPRRAADLARVLSIRDPDGDWIARAREWLTAASADASAEGACASALALARLEARDASAPRAAYLVAFRASLRFAASDAACAGEAEAMMRTLDAWRPSTAELGAIRADPDAEVDPAAVDPIARWAAEHSDEEAATLESLLVYGHGDDAGADTVRVVLTFDRVVAFEHGEAEATADGPRRTWLQLASVTPGEGVARSLPVGSGGLVRLTVADQAGGTRVAFELEGTSRFDAFALPDPFRIVLDFETGGARARGPVRRIVIDPGHGGDDFGARAFGLRESDLTLDIARRVRALLLSRLPDVAVIMTREEDVLISLEARAALANAVGADLFLSIHLNAADEPVDHGGVTTFVLDTSDDRQAARLAARENRTSVAEVSSLSRLLASLHRQDQVAASREVADQIHRSTLAAGRAHLPHLYDRGVRAATFYVLVGARMPAVLLEASFLSREDEANALRTPTYRQALAEGVASGVVSWAAR